MPIRSFWRAVKVETAEPPYDTLHLKVLYPAQETEKEQQIFLPANSEIAPFPVIIFFNGANCSLEGYQWLGVELAKRGTVVILFNWVAELIPGIVGLAPARFNQDARKPDVYGTIPTTTVLPLILAELERLNSQGLLAGMLDLENIAIGGHSAGARLALENATPQFFPQLKAVFVYGGHSAGAVQSGYEPGTILKLPSILPTLLIGGNCDGIIANASSIYGLEKWETPATPIIRTFKEGISSDRNDSYLVILAGANHYSINQNIDITDNLSYRDFTATQPREKIHSLLAETISLFIESYLLNQDSASDRLMELLETNKDLIANFDRK
ncbi:MAG: alpha/beta hydrolase family protein [Prochloraceae cyanobacterium]